METPRAKKHRLPDAAYIGRRAVSFVVCEQRRRPVLADAVVVDAFVPMLGEAAESEGCIIPIYCFMPNHLHIMVLGLHEKSRPKVAMERFKHAAGRWARHDLQNTIQLQNDFYDQIVRRSEGYAAHVRYIALNPVRAGLAPDVHAWPFTGSIGAELDEVIVDAFWQ